MTDEHWRTAELISVLAPDERRRHIRIGAAGLVTFSSIVVLLLSWGRDEQRCGQSCFGAPPLDRYGSITYQPGHHWTRYAGSWQWSAQSGLAYLAVIATSFGIALAMLSRRSPSPAFLLGALATSGWLVWVLASPATT